MGWFFGNNAQSIVKREPIQYVPTLTGNPNYFIVDNNASDAHPQELYILLNPYYRSTLELGNESTIDVVRSDGSVYRVKATDNIYLAGQVDSADGRVMYYWEWGQLPDNADRLAAILLADSWIASHFDIDVPLQNLGNTPIMMRGSQVYIKGKSAESDYSANWNMEADNMHPYMTRSFIRETPDNGGALFESGTIINVEVMGGVEVFLGTTDRPVGDAMGRKVAEFEKEYYGAPLWFDINSLTQQIRKYNLPTGVTGWFDAGTNRVYRIRAYRDGQLFYVSSALFCLSGNMPLGTLVNMDDYVVNISDYIHEPQIVKLLTNRPLTKYMRGQREYINFILADSLHGQEPVTDWINSFEIVYKVYTHANEYLGSVTAHLQDRNLFDIVNTCQLDMDAVLVQYPQAGIIRVELSSNAGTATESIDYFIVPDCWGNVQSFSFLNRLGGWDAFNFNAKQSIDIGSDSDKYYRTITPDWKLGDGKELTINEKSDMQITITGAPVTDTVALWLREFAMSPVILDMQGRRIIIDDFKMVIDPTKTDFQRPVMKYHYSAE